MVLGQVFRRRSARKRSGEAGEPALLACRPGGTQATKPHPEDFRSRKLLALRQGVEERAVATVEIDLNRLSDRGGLSWHDLMYAVNERSSTRTAAERIVALISE